MSAMRRKLRIDFAPRGWRRTLYHLHPVVLAAGVAGLLLCVSAALGGWHVVELRRAREQALRQIEERQAAQRARPVAVAAVAIPEAQATFVNGAVMQLNLPWRALQDAVAAATPPTVALLALEPDPRKRVLKLTAETKSSDDMIAYVEQLKEQELFSGVLLTRHEINEQDSNHPLRFQLEARWVAR
jgi:Tfp pilus assembly protein PilN